MKVSFLFHLYQPSYQEEAIFKKVAEESYIPLLKFIKSNRDFVVTLNTPLSLLEQMDRYGYNEWLLDVKELMKQGRVELIGSGAYHPLLTKIPTEYAYRQIILNEYGLGYYFGRKRGFEGEEAIMIEGLKGFFPPELAVNETVVKILNDLSYEWVLVDETAVYNNESHSSVMRLKDYDIKLVVRNLKLSNYLGFKRGAKINDIQHLFKDINVIALDGETFGHHNKKGELLLHNILSYTKENDISILKVSDLINDSDISTIETINESTWGASIQQMTENTIYPMWDARDNEVHILQWKILNKIIEIDKDNTLTTIHEDYSNIPLWKEEIRKKVPEDMYKLIRQDILLNKIMNSDQFWWSSKARLHDGQVLNHPGFVRKSMKMIDEYLGGLKISKEEVASIMDLLKELDTKLNENI